MAMSLLRPDPLTSQPGAWALDDGVRRRSWAELFDRVDRIARLLREDLAVAPGEVVGTLLSNRVECVELMLGAIHAGVWLTPINWHLIGEEIDYVIGDSGARVLFTDDDYAGAASGHPACTELRVGDDLERAIASASDAPMDPDGPAGGPLIYTSGTTGRPKGVKRNRGGNLGDVLRNQRPMGTNVGLDGRGPHLITGPCYHAAPLMFAIYDQSNGAPIRIMSRWDERDALRLIQELEVGQAHFVPTMFVRLLRLPEEERRAFEAPALHVALHGAAPVSRDVKQRMIDWWGPILLEYWGATESGVVTLVDSEAWVAHPGTVGRALPSFEVFAADDSGQRLPDGEEGLLYIRHRTLENLFEYHGAPEKTAECYLAPDVFTIGDIGHVDEDGWLYLADRKSHTIISGGVNIYPTEIEHVLQQHPAVADVAVFGVPDDDWGESVKAAVELRPGHDAGPALERALLEYAREHLARYKVPRSIDFETRLPRHASGKLYVRHLKDRYWKDHGRRIG